MFCIRAAVFCCLLAVGCGQDGAVHVRVLLPDNMQLSPVASKLARLTLVTETDGAPPQSETRNLPAMPASAGAVSFGDVSVAPGVRMSLLGYTTAGRLVGFGRASVPVDVNGGDVVDVEIRLRRPFAYVAGGAKLNVFDTTVEAGQSFISTIDGALAPLATATAPDGMDLAVVSGTQLALYSTGNHARATTPGVTVQQGARQVAISPDARWVVVLHTATEMPAGVSVVDLAAMRKGQATAVFVAVEGAGALAVSNDAAHVLVSPSVPGPPPAYVEDCSKASKVVTVTLSPAKAGSPVALAGAARDLAVMPDGSAVFVAEPCVGSVVAVRGGGAIQVRLMQVPSVTDVAVAGDRVWAVGQDGPANGVHMVLASAGTDSTAASRLDLPATQELAQSITLSESGQAAEVRLDADRLDAFSLAVLPDARHVALLVHGSYHANEVVRPVDIAGIEYDETIVPRLDVEAYEYQLVDVTTGIAVQRLRTSCRIEWEHGVAVLDDWQCASASGQGTTPEDFVPRQAAVLYGGQ